MESINKTEIYFDPFADDEGMEFNAAESFDIIFERYTNNEVEHDYSTDQFLKDTEALMLDAQFNDQLKQMMYITAQMHALCMHDRELQNRMPESVFADLWHDASGEHEHGAPDEKSKKKSKKVTKLEERTKNQPPRGFFAIIWQNVGKEVKIL